MAEELQNIVYEQPTTLQPAADAIGLKIVSTEWFSRAGGDGITSKRPFIDSALLKQKMTHSSRYAYLSIVSRDRKLWKMSLMR